MSEIRASGTPDFEDARLLLVRAKEHYQEFDARIHGKGGLWSYSLKQIDGARFAHSLALNRLLIPKLKPVVGDIANNLRHALDQLSSAVARTTLSHEKQDKRRQDIAFPFPDDRGEISSALEKRRFFLGDAYASKVEEVWHIHRAYEYYFRVVRTISNHSKHWVLELVHPNAHAVQLIKSGEARTPVQIPKDHFATNDEFRWTNGLAHGCEFLIDLRFSDIQPRPQSVPMAPSPDSVFSCTIRYVEDMIVGFEAVAASTQEAC